MNKSTIRISVLLLLYFVFVFSVSVYAAEFSSKWPDRKRTWIGPEYWANRLQDWQINHGKLECLASQPRLQMRTVHLLTHRLADQAGDFKVQVRTGLLNEETQEVRPNSATGILVGVGGRKMDYRAAAIVHGVSGQGAGIFAGIDARGNVFIRDNQILQKPADRSPAKENFSARLRDIQLQLNAEQLNNQSYKLTLVVQDKKTNQVIGRAALVTDSSNLIGNVALVSHPGVGNSRNPSGRYWFSDLKIAGEKVHADDKRILGPIISSQYTLSREVLKLTAQMAPLSESDNQIVRLQFFHNGEWNTFSAEKLVRPGFTATFRVPGWDSSKDTQYRVQYRLKEYGDREKNYYWGGTIRKDPVGEDEIIVAGFTGNHNNSHRISQQGFDWTTGMWFPHDDMSKQVAKHKPDLLFFSGDQVYEGRSPTFADRANIKLDYMYKWYLWCWAYRELSLDIPCVSIPDDHDVYQGNIWGEGGRKTDKDDKGGYVNPADFVKMVERTQTSNLPDPFDPTPIGQDIGVYYTNMVYGGISFAILEDRKFKSGCNGRLPDSGSPRADHISDPKFDVLRADVAGLKLLGDRQLKFLRHWSSDWSGAEMKMAMSQTIFANMATHHGPGLNFLIADLDSNGWPQSGRNRAIRELRRCFAFHLAGDQHLATIVHHGIDQHDDSIWSFCVPSIANFYPRMWQPEAEGQGRPEGSPTWMGRHFDGLKNRVTVYANTNPGPKTGKQPTDLHDKMPGYGIVRLNKKHRTITMECWPRYVDPQDPSTGKQYPGWPMTIRQEDNYARRAFGYLPMIRTKGMENPVVQVIAQADGENIYTIRTQGNSYRPKVFQEGSYRVKVGELGTEKIIEFNDLKPNNEKTGKVLEADF